MNHFLLIISLLLLLFCKRGDASVESRRYNILKFGQTGQDYLMYKPDMQPLESSFTVCAWVKKLFENGHASMWFSYATSEAGKEGKEITITDSGTHTNIFGDETELQSVYTVPHGQWFHNCLSWSAASQTRNVYINGVLVDAKGTPAMRTLGQDGYLVIGNQQTSYGSGLDNLHIFGGELYKLNVFSKMLTASEIRKMSFYMCSTVEETYGATRHIKWEEVIQVSSKGNVYEIESGCGSEEDTGYTRMQNILEQMESELNKTVKKLDTVKARVQELEKTEEQLSKTVMVNCT